MNRRTFMQQSAGLTTLLASGASVPGFLTRTAVASGGARPDEPIMVVVQLTGGNDGLNTVIPYADDAYHRARPTLRIDPSAVLKLDDEFGLHPSMTAIKTLYDEGSVSVVNSVGYPNPDRSHFRSMDIWHAGETTLETARDGWVGRAVRSMHGANGAPPALHVGGGQLPLALASDGNVVPSLRGIDTFRLHGAPASLAPAVAADRACASDDLMFVQRVAVSSCANATRLRDVASDDGTRGYPGYGLAGRLRQIATLIRADFGASVYYTSIGGFDTHAQQAFAHEPLLREVSESIGSFQRDIEACGLADRVVLVTFSEFGRRVAENGSRGTDHGAAAPMFVVGRPARGGLIGDAPALSTLLDGDVPYEVDFRRVYATLLDRWLGVGSRGVLGERFPHVPLLNGQK